MKLASAKPIVISIGGSLIVPGEIDRSWLEKFRSWLIEQIGQGRQFWLVCGGGGTARQYQTAARALGVLSGEALDQLGILATKLNARLVYTALTDLIPVTLIESLNRAVADAEGTIIIGGDQPGYSSDYVAVVLAETAGAERLINLTDVAYVYDRNPDDLIEAKPLPRLTWPEFLALLPTEWSPGLKSPFDPEAARRAAKLEVELAIISGRDLASVEAYLSAGAFVGTLIK